MPNAILIDGAIPKGIVNEEDIQYIHYFPLVLAIYCISSQLEILFRQPHPFWNATWD
jgi:hypothetical protein